VSQEQIIFQTTEFGHSPSDGMRVLGRGELPTPGACVVCGNGTCDDGYLFLGIHVDFHGALLLCQRCVVQGSEKMGCMSPDIADRIHVQAQELATEVVMLRRETEAQRVRLAIFDDALRTIQPVVVAGVSHSGLRADSDESSEQRSDEAAQSDPVSESAEPGESVEEPGIDDAATVTSSDITSGFTELSGPARPTFNL